LICASDKAKYFWAARLTRIRDVRPSGKSGCLLAELSVEVRPIADIEADCHSLSMAGAPKRIDEGICGALQARAAPHPSRSVRDGNYLIAHACFDCRKSWKVRADTGKCPQCGAPLHEMGRSFKAPKQSDAEQWQKVQALWSAGFRFWSYRSHPDAEPLPERLRDVDDFIRRNQKHPMRIKSL
jgi:hypothetical protein